LQNGGRGICRALFLFGMDTRYGLIDRLLIAADEALRTLSGSVSASRPSPAGCLPEAVNAGDAARLMRVNHAGEVCAQALYSGQSLFARDERVREALRTAASEERDHLSWCRKRLDELQSRPSVLDPLWYAGSFGLGMLSGAAGDRWSLGFLAETEAQVEKHLDGHLGRLVPDDARSRAVIEQMREDESRHGAVGRALGGDELPLPVKLAMRMASKVMTRTAYWV
jgi:ubiquinone biosynthesis monooxygenase Coq7